MQALTDDMKMSVHEFMDMAALTTHYELIVDPETVATCHFPDRDQIKDYGYPCIKFHGLRFVLNQDDSILYVAQFDNDEDIVNCGMYWVLDPESVEYLMMQDPTE